MDEDALIEVFDCVSEMTSDASSLVSLPPDLVAAVTDGDDDPKFGTFVIESGWSKSKRFWGAELFQNVAEQINNPNEPLVGYMGHIRPQDDPYTFPAIQLHWLKAKVIQAGENSKLAVKAYLLPGEKGRDYMKRGLVRTVSWRGKAASVPYQRGVRITDFILESIDLSRPRAAGMSARLVGGLTSEMEEGATDVKPEEIAALQENELRAHNPTLVGVIEGAARTPLDNRISEMETENNEQKTTLSKIRTALGLPEDANLTETIEGMARQMQAAAADVRKALLHEVLDRKFKDAGTRKLVAHALVGEMSGLDLKLSEGDHDKDAQIVSEMVNNYIDRDDDLKALVSEMEPTPPAPPGVRPPDPHARELKPGTTTSNLRVRAAG